MSGPATASTAPAGPVSQPSPTIRTRKSGTSRAVGDGGSIVDLEAPGALASALELYQEPALREAHGHLAHFLAMYAAVLGRTVPEPTKSTRRCDSPAATELATASRDA